MRFLLLLMCWLPLTINAASVIKSVVTHDEETDRYSLVADILVDAAFPAVYNILTDYKNLSQLSELITESTVIQQYNDNHYRIRLISHSCVLFFCSDIVRTQDITHSPDGIVDAVIVPELSNFKSAHSRWILNAQGDKTLIHYETESVPDFWVPPLIGPYFFKSAMQEAAVDLAEGIERRAHELSPNEK